VKAAPSTDLIDSTWNWRVLGEKMFLDSRQVWGRSRGYVLFLFGDGSVVNANYVGNNLSTRVLANTTR